MNPLPTQIDPLLSQLDREIEEEEEDYFDYHYDEPGSEPGTLSIEPDASPSKIVLIDYDGRRAIRQVNVNPDFLTPYLGSNTVSWMDVQGLGSEVILKQVGDIFHLHPLLLEDVVNVPQRAKVDDYREQLLVLAHMVRPKRNKAGFETEQVSFILGKGYLLTVQEEELEDCFDPVRKRIRTNQGKIRQAGSDYLLYMLLDVLIDSYFPVLEHYEDRIEELEDAILLNPSENLMEELYGVRRELLALRRLLWPMQNVLNTIIRGDYKLINNEVQIYFRDCYDHVIQLIDILETYRELTASLMELYLNSISNKMNEVMKLLTAVSTIFIPLTFIAGVYGMNFENMPELRQRWGYYGALVLMGTIAASLVYFFWSRGWFAQPYSSVKIKAKKERKS